MPVIKCSNGKYRIGHGPCMYHSKDSAEKAYKGYLGNKYGEKMSLSQELLNSLYERTGEDVLMDRAKELVGLIKKSPNNPEYYTELKTVLRSWPDIRANDIGASAVKGKDIILQFKFSDIADKAIKSIKKDLDVKIDKQDSCTLRINV